MKYSFLKEGLGDLERALKNRDQWFWMGMQDIRMRYRRTTLGPLWLTISSVVTILIVSFVFSRVLDTGALNYAAYFSVGYVMWVFFATQMTESVYGFINYSAVIRQSNAPLSSYVLRITWKNIIVFFHQAIAFLWVVFAFPGESPLMPLLSIVGLVLFFAFSFFLSLVLATICARFRDLGSLVTNGLQVVYFITPILWHTEMLGESAWIANINPFSHIIDLVRLPLLGQMPVMNSYIIVVTTVLLSAVFCVVFFSKHRHKIVFWV